MRRYSIEPRTRTCIKGYGFLSFARKYKKQILDTGLDSLKPTSEKVVHRASELIGNKITDAVTKPNDDGNVEEIIIPPEKRDETLNKLRKVL